MIIKTTRFIIVLSIFIASTAFATDYYVDASIGNDSNSGTELNPFLTISKGATVVSPGDTVYVKTGVYDESVTMSTSGTSGNLITFIAYPGHTPVVDGTGIAVAKLVDFPAKNYIVWDGIDVRDAQSWGIWVEGDYNQVLNCKIYDNGLINSKSGLEVIAADYTIVRNNEIYNSGWNGLNVESCNYTTIEYNLIYNNAGHMGVNIFPITGTGGAMFTGNNVKYNKIHNNGGAGIYVRYQQDFEYVGNLIYENTYTGIKFTYESGYSTTYICNGKIYNNTIVDNSEDGIRSQSGNNLEIKNNIISGSAGYDINIYSGVTTGHDFDYNLFYHPTFNNNWGGSAYTSLASWQSASSQDANSLNSDPLYTNPSGDDYTLPGNSPAVNNGTNLGVSYNKLVKQTSTWPNGVVLLTQDSNWDIGSYAATYKKRMFIILMSMLNTNEYLDFD